MPVPSRRTRRLLNFQAACAGQREEEGRGEVLLGWRAEEVEEWVPSEGDCGRDVQAEPGRQVGQHCPCKPTETSGGKWRFPGGGGGRWGREDDGLGQDPGCMVTVSWAAHLPP